MEKLKISEIVNAVEGEIIIDGKYYDYSSVGIDTRKLSQNSIFIALKGDNFNANDFVEEAVNKGSVICIVDEIKFKPEDIKEGTTIIKVADGRKALRDLAKYYRSRLDIKIIGVTGSTGKTSTKDLIAAALGAKYKVFKTKGNFNNEVGLPLMIFNLDNSYDVAVLEMGMNNPGEIHRLADIARPDIAVITNIGISHIENLKTRENILKAKLEITDYFGENNTLIVNAENDLLTNLKSENFNVKKVGLKDEFDFSADNIVLGEDSIRFNLKEKGKAYSSEIFVPAVGIHNVLNSLLASACGKLLKLEGMQIVEGIKELEATSMRLDIIRSNGITIIDDSYNASPDSMKAALNVLADMKGTKKIAVLGTMRELGDMSYEAHREVGEYAALKGVNLLITLGEYSEAFRQGFGNSEGHMELSSNEEAITYLNKILNAEDIVLVKASRAMQFEKIVQGLKKVTNEGGEILH